MEPCHIASLIQVLFFSLCVLHEQISCHLFFVFCFCMQEISNSAESQPYLTTSDGNGLTAQARTKARQRALSYFDAFPGGALPVLKKLKVYLSTSTMEELDGVVPEQFVAHCRREGSTALMMTLREHWYGMCCLFVSFHVVFTM
jgi:hypothetical protein